MGLAMLGGVVLAAVIAYNAWQSRKNAPRKAGPSTLQPLSVLGDRTEPEFQVSSSDAFRAGTIWENEQRNPARKLGLDVLIDVVTLLVLDVPVPGERILAAIPSTRRVGSKPFAVEASNAATGEWENPVQGQTYSAVQAGVQLANRHGALNEIEFSEFVVKVQALADALGASVDFPVMRDEVQRARELDQFASTHDAQLAFTLRALQSAWSPGYIHQQAAALGFVPGSLPGRMVLPGSTPGSAPLLSLMFDSLAALAEDPEQTALRDINLLLDVAHVPQGEQPYQRMRIVAASLAQSMDAILTDDRGQRLTPEALDSIGMDLETLYADLAQRDLHAGSALARRLFS